MTSFRISGAEQILASLGPGQTEVTLYTPPVGINENGDPLDWYAYINSLRVKIQLPSLAEGDLPTGFEDFGALEQQAAIRDLMWESERIKLDLLLVKDAQEFNLSSVSLINRAPFWALSLLIYLTDDVDFLIGPGTTLKARIVDQGWGTLQTGDSLVFYGSARTKAPGLAGLAVAGGGGYADPWANANSEAGSVVIWEG